MTMPRSYPDKLADACGAGCDASTARDYAGGSGPLSRLVRIQDEDESEEEFLQLEEE